MEVVQYYNPNMTTLYERFVAQEPLMMDSTDRVVEAAANGDSVYRLLIDIQVELANAVHDYVWNVTRPFDSLIIKSHNREMVCRDIFGIEATF
jgi:hypothetical protein